MINNLTFMHGVEEKSIILSVCCHGYCRRQDAPETGGSWLVRVALGAAYGQSENS